MKTSFKIKFSSYYKGVEARDSALQAHVGDLLDVCLLRAKYVLFEVYKDWVHKNPGKNLEDGITEYIKWQVRWEKLSVCQTNGTIYHLEKSGEDLSEPFLWSSVVYELGSGALRR